MDEEPNTLTLAQLQDEQHALPGQLAAAVAAGDVSEAARLLARWQVLAPAVLMAQAQQARQKAAEIAAAVPGLHQEADRLDEQAMKLRPAWQAAETALYQTTEHNLPMWNAAKAKLDAAKKAFDDMSHESHATREQASEADKRAARLNENASTMEAEAQRQVTALLGLTKPERSMLYDLAATTHSGFLGD